MNNILKIKLQLKKSLVEAMYYKKVSQSKMAKDLGVSRASINNIMKLDVEKVSIDKYIELLQYLKIDVSVSISTKAKDDDLRDKYLDEFFNMITKMEIDSIIERYGDPEEKQENKA